MSKYRVALVGATGAVGREVVRLLESCSFPLAELHLFASPSSAGKKILFRTEELTLQTLSEDSFTGIDFALFGAGKEVSRQFVPHALKAGATVIDKSSLFRLQPDVPLIIPEVNGHLLNNPPRLLAAPGCVTTLLLMAIAPLHRKWPMERLVISTYQSASGAGAKAMEELTQETAAFLKGAPFQGTSMPHPYAFNLFLHDAPMTASSYNDEEEKVIRETRKILEVADLPMAVTCVRVPVLRAHSMAVNVQFRESVTADEAAAVLRASPGLRLIEEWGNNRFPMPIDASGGEDVLVGRIRRDLSHPHALDLWIVGDQLLKGAALNAVQILERLK